MAGNMVFAVSDEYIDSRVGGQRTASLINESLPLVMIWLQQTMVRGDMSNDSVLRDNQKLLALRKSVLHHKLVSEQPANPCFNFEKTEDLFSQFKLKMVWQGAGDLFDFRIPGENMCRIQGYYLLYVRTADDTHDHTFGLKFSRQSGNYLFDPNAGLFRYSNVEDLLMNLTHLNTTAYYDFLGGQYWFRQLILG